jgi:hypothetical protein
MRRADPAGKIIGMPAAPRRERDDGGNFLRVFAGQRQAPQAPAEWPITTMASGRMKDCLRMKPAAAAISSAVARPALT